MFGLDDSITKEEVKSIIADIGKCKGEDVRISDIKAMRSGLGMIWAQCPLKSAITLSKLQQIRIG